MNRPESATHGLVALSGVGALLAGVALLNWWAPPLDIAYLALIVMTCTAVGILVPDLGWQRVQRRSLVPAAARGNWPRTFTKAAGLVGATGVLALIYFVLPEYYLGRGFYGHCITALEIIMPVWAILALPYLYWVDRRMSEPHDGLWHLGKIVSCRWRGADLQLAARYQMGWFVKGFFLPLMFTYFCNDLNKLLHYNLQSLRDVKGWYEWAYFTLYFIDVALVSMTYLVSLRASDSHIRSTEPTALGWLVALLCYQPFWSLINKQYISYEGPVLWDRVLKDLPALAAVWGIAILSLVAIYVWATASFGGRFSNLTHRGIITQGPYRFSKHPAYLAKNLSWWLIAMPFIVSDGWQESIRRCAMLGMLNGIYYLRAKTEERHLSLDPVYRQYAAWMDQHGLLRFLNRIPVVGVAARWCLAPLPHPQRVAENSAH